MKFFYRILLYSLVNLVAISTFAQNKHAETNNAKQPIELRSSDKYLKYADDSDFNYLREEAKRPTSIWEYLRRFLFRTLDFIFDNKFAKVIFYLILFITIAFVVYRLLGYQYSGFWYNARSFKRTDGEVYEEDIYHIDFEKEIKNALQKGDYRLVVRYKYLHLLVIFAEKDIIEMHPHKTNQEYRYEIRKKGYGKTFDALTYIYEHVWYGDFPVSDQIFKRSNDAYDLLKKQVKKG